MTSRRGDNAVRAVVYALIAQTAFLAVVVAVVMLLGAPAW